MGKYGKGSYSDYRGKRRLAISIDGKRKEFYGKTDKECYEKYISFISAYKEETPTKAILFSTVIDKWYKEIKEPYCSPSSRLNYQLYIDKINKSFLGTTLIKEITSATINKFFARSEIVKLKKKTYLKAIMRGAFQYAIENDYIIKNPFISIKFENDNSAEETIKVFSKSDVNKIIEFAKTDKQFGVQILMLLYTGLRRGELCAIHKSDINFKENYITVNKAVSKDESGFFLANTTKTKRSRIVPINEDLCRRLQQLNNDCCIWNGKEFYSPRTFETEYEKFFKRLNASLSNGEKVAYLSPHKMRHTFATYSLKGCKNLRAVQEILGHSKSSTTEIYTHIDIDDKKKVINNIAY